MKVLSFLKHKKQGAANKFASGNQIVVSLIEKKNQAIEKRLMNCMKEIQLLMASKRQIKKPINSAKILNLVTKKIDGQDLIPST